MGLDFIVLQIEHADGTTDWRGQHLNSRRADDDHPDVLKVLQSIYQRKFSPEELERSKEAADWTWVEPAGVGSIALNILISPFYLLHLLISFNARRRDKARVTPSFED